MDGFLRSFDEFYEQSRYLVLSLCASNLPDPEDALDAFQNVYCMLLQTLHLAPAHPGANEQPNSVLYRITIREIQRMRKRREREAYRRKTIKDVQTLAAPCPTPRETAQHNEMHRGIRSGLACLPKDQKELLSLAYGQEMSHKAIASHMGCSRSTITRRIAAVLERMRLHLEAEMRMLSN